MNKILFVLPNLKIGGTVSSFLNLYSKLSSDRKYKISIVCLSDNGKKDWPFMKDVLPCSKTISYFTFNYTDLSLCNKVIAFPIKVAKRICRSLDINLRKYLYEQEISRLCLSKYDTIIAFQEDEPTFFLQYSNHPNKIAWIHCSYKYRHETYGIDEHDIYKSYSAIVSVSRHTCLEFCNTYPSLSSKATFIYNIQNADYIIKSSSQPVSDKFPKDTLNIVSVGRISKVKRFSHIPSIAKELKKSGIKFRWYIIGPAYSEEYEEYERLQDNITDDIRNEVIIMGARSNPYPYIKDADLLVCVSESEACPMIFNEAKVLHTPIVSTDFGSAEEFLGNSEYGLIANISEISDAIKTILTDRYIYDHIVNNMKQFADPTPSIMAKIEHVIRTCPSQETIKNNL